MKSIFKSVMIFTIFILGVTLPLALYFNRMSWKANELFYRNIITGEIRLSLTTHIINTYIIVGSMILLFILFDNLLTSLIKLLQEGMIHNYVK